jgi:hypothetical protein
MARQQVLYEPGRSVEILVGEAGLRHPICPLAHSRLYSNACSSTIGAVTENLLADAHHLSSEAIDALFAAAGSGTGDDELLSVVTICECLHRRLDQLTVAATAELSRRGTFAERGYRDEDEPGRCCATTARSCGFLRWREGSAVAARSHRRGAGLQSSPFSRAIRGSAPVKASG